MGGNEDVDRHRTHCISLNLQVSEGKEGMDEIVMKGEMRIFLKKGEIFKHS